jgi:hypothetical protein
MDWQSALRARLKADAPVVTLVGTRIDWVDRPQTTALPAITLQTISDLRPQHMGGFDGTKEARVQVDVWAATYASAKAITEAVLAVLVPANTANGVSFSRAFVDNIRDLGERIETQFIHRTSMDLIIHHASA